MHAIQPSDSATAPPQPSTLTLDRTWRIDRNALEVLLYGLLLLVSIGLHLWQLGAKAMHHDESIHAWMSYKFFTGSGGFSCWGGRQAPTYCYDPVYHGPTLYILTLLSYLLFGVGDAQARLPQALAGIALVPLAWTLRPFIGRKGALIAAALLTISPSILYYTRSARHDAFMLVWALLMVVGLFRFLRSGRATDLALATAGLALAWATHELVFILIFIGATFFGLRLVWEWQPRALRRLVIGVLAFGLLFALAYFGISRESWPAMYRWTHRFFGPVLMLVIGALLAAGMTRSWERAPVMRQRLLTTWREHRAVYGIALATFLAIFALCFTTFFAYPRGFLDGWYAGITYWLGSQHEFARGGQPWFYYLMLLPLYEPLALGFSLVGLIWLLRGAVPWRASALTSAANGHGELDEAAVAVEAPPTAEWPQARALLICFLAYWFVLAFVGFSWAGEKMPWLLIHIALPATLLASWVLSVLIERVPWRRLRSGLGWAVPLLTLVLLLALVNAMLAFAGGDATVGGLQTRLQGLVPLLVGGLCMFGLLSLVNRWGARLVLRLAGLTLAGVLLLYGVRAMTLVVYRHPDVPVEPLIYTQTAPDVPILVRRIEELALNRTRNLRSAADPTGGHSLPIALDGGSASQGGEGSLAWPLQWYLRDYLNVQWIDVTAGAAVPQDAVVVVLYKPHVTPAVEAQLEDDYVRVGEGVFNWWFPEYTGDPDPNRPGQPPARGYKSLALDGATAWQRVWNVISWPLRPANWPTLWDYVLYRKLPMELKGREMVIFIRRDALPAAGAAAAPATPTATLTAEVVVAGGVVQQPRGITIDREGHLVVADAGQHRILVVDQNGQVLRTIGAPGHAPGQFHEPSGVAVDDAGHLYVADTWNARVVKLDAQGRVLASWGSGAVPFGAPLSDPVTGQTLQRYAVDNGGDPAANQRNPLGFFGPRSVLVHRGRVYIADTGNSRIVVTDLNGTVLQQFGSEGSAPGQLREPIGLAVDGRERLYVGDTWNARIQVFQITEQGVDPTPLAELPVRGWAANTYDDPAIAAAPDGRLWASVARSNSIAEFGSDGRLLRRITTTPPLNLPKGLVWAGGALYVVNGAPAELLRLAMP